MSLHITSYNSCLDLQVTNIQPGYVYTEGLERMLREEGSRAALEQFGLGEPDQLLTRTQDMLRPEVGSVLYVCSSLPATK